MEVELTKSGFAAILTVGGLSAYCFWTHLCDRFQQRREERRALYFDRLVKINGAWLTQSER